jgi:hypothetical protein
VYRCGFRQRNTKDFSIHWIQQGAIDGTRDSNGLRCFEIVTVVRYVTRVKYEWVSENIDRIRDEAKEIRAGIKSPNILRRYQIDVGNGDPHVSVTDDGISGPYA